MTRVIALLALAACGGTAEPPTPEPEPEATSADEELRKKAKGAFGVVPMEAPSEKNPITDEKIVLGRTLYYDPRLSTNDEISCNSCHNLETYGVDNEPTSPGHEGKRGARNSPTVFNAAAHISQFWDGRAADVEEQAKGPILNPVEMGMGGEEDVLKKLEGIDGYSELFTAAFPDAEDPITYDNLAAAIGAFERKLFTPAPFDAWLEGDDDALTGEQKAGLQTFMDAGCTTCHSGNLFGGHMYQKLGLVEPYETEDMGRFEATENEADKFMFKVPSLRNIEKTGPYWHDGSVTELSEAIRLMAKHQLGKELAEDEVSSIETFLGSLTGTIDEDYIKKPAMPGM